MATKNRTKEQFISFMKENNAWDKYYANIENRIKGRTHGNALYHDADTYIDWIISCTGVDSLLASTRPIRTTMGEEYFWVCLQAKWDAYDPDKPKPVKKSQNAMILEHLQQGRTLTTLQALDLFGCIRLGARIADLKAAGHIIKTTMVTTSTGKRVAEYSLVTEAE